MSRQISQEKGRPTIQRLVHTDFGSGKPYRDDDLNMSQSEEHRISIQYLCYCFQLIAKNLGLGCISDNIDKSQIEVK